MDSVSEVILVLKLAMNIAPVAMYFIILGLVNSQPRPHIITARRDWLYLMVVFGPVLSWPVIWLASAGWILGSLIVLAVGVALVVTTAPRRRSGWVIYNCNLKTVTDELLDTLRALGRSAEVHSRTLITTDNGVEFELTELRLLRNVTVTLQHADPKLAHDVGDALHRRLASLDSQPSLSAAAMLVSGATLLMVPLTMMVGRMDSFVKVVTDLIPV